MESGLYQYLVKKQYLVEHEELDDINNEDGIYKIIKPKQIPFISYCYEWTFSQLKAAALLTIEIQRLAIEHGMTLKDATSFNVQFDGTKPIFIDTLSFEKKTNEYTWVGYKQFCQHFLAPLLLMSKVDSRLNQLCKNYIDGTPLELAANILPFRTRFNLAIYIHIFLHSKFQLQTRKKAWSNNNKDEGNTKLSKLKILGILDSLNSVIRKLKNNKQFSAWENYYEELHYKNESEVDKIKFVKQCLECINADTDIKLAIDIGSNNGNYSNILADYSKKIISIDSDISCIEYMFNKGIKKEYLERKQILPLVIDMANPSPSIGWNNNERDSFFSRKKFDVTLFLAIIHHLVFNNNCSLEQIAHFLSNFSKKLIIEFVQEDDPMVLNMISGRNVQLKNYNKENFEKSFEKYFFIIQKKEIVQSKRIIYLMKNCEEI
jgi:SAM-dependent methyltransferase